MNIKSEFYHTDAEYIKSIASLRKEPVRKPGGDGETKKNLKEELKPSSHAERLKAEALSIEHLRTHDPKNPYCKFCVRDKMYADQHRKWAPEKQDEVEVVFGKRVAGDHIVLNQLKDAGFEGQTAGLVIKDIGTKFLGFEIP